MQEKEKVNTLQQKILWNHIPKKKSEATQQNGMPM